MPHCLQVILCSCAIDRKPFIQTFPFVLMGLGLLCLTGCATGYHREGFLGGYSDAQLGEDVFQVRFNGNGYTGSGRAADFALLRCAEVAIENGYPYFVIVNGENTESRSTHTTPTTTTGSATVVGNSIYGTVTTTGGQTYDIVRPSTRNTIIGLKKKPSGLAYESAHVIRSFHPRMKMKEKDVNVAMALGVLPGGGSFYTSQWGVGVVDVALWPYSILWDPFVGRYGANKINEEIVLRRTLLKQIKTNELSEHEHQLEENKITQTE